MESIRELAGSLRIGGVENAEKACVRRFGLIRLEHCLAAARAKSQGRQTG
jgi:hypothetical protein